MSERLIEKSLSLLKDTKVSNYRIAKETGISESAIGRYKNEKSRPTLANAKILIQFFEGTLPEFNINNVQPVSDFTFLNVPFVPVYAQGSYPRGFGDQEYIESLPTMPIIVDRNYKGKYRVFEVQGDSMDDGSRSALYDGDKILCREVKQELWTSKLHIKDWFFVIVCRTDGITVKQITEHKVETGEILCHPLNPMFEDFTLNLNDVVELYNVIKIVDRNTRI
ncbi:LexA family transcriptional regulator [Paludibacteraceae bacterium OttesenSCG-928-F17]|nr:LexA family transcriptional regulator [Paludibacteraceae bacterium OttesenSCG-928-F17]